MLAAHVPQACFRTPVVQLNPLLLTRCSASAAGPGPSGQGDIPTLKELRSTPETHSPQAGGDTHQVRLLAGYKVCQDKVLHTAMQSLAHLVQCPLPRMVISALLPPSAVAAGICAWGE
jgi:hypothetical protein